MLRYPTCQEVRERLDMELAMKVSEDVMGLVQNIVVMAYADGYRDGQIESYLELEKE